MIMAIIFMQVALGDPSVSIQQNSSHIQGIKVYAGLVALSQVAIRYCNSVGANLSLIKNLGKNVQYDPAKDADFLNKEAAVDREAFESEIRGAPSVENWCSHEYELFGPDGTSIRGLFWQAR